MTELGRSLIKEGKQENARETAKRAIKKGMSDELIGQLIELPVEQIHTIRIAMRWEEFNKRRGFV